MKHRVFKEAVFERESILINQHTGSWIGGDINIIQDLYEIIERGDSPLLIEKGYYELVKESKLLGKPYPKKKRIPQLIVIHIGHKCNLNCKYCYAKDDRESINMETIKRVADFLSEINAPLWIQFMGGEPLLYTDLLDDFIKRIKEARKKLKTFFELQTNGTLLGKPSVLEFINKNEIRFGISYDGPGKLSGNRYYRKTKIYDSIVNHNISELASLGFSFGVLTVVSNSNVNNLREVLQWAISKKVKRISFSPAVPINNKEIDTIDPVVYQNNLTALYNDWIEEKIYKQIDICNFSILTDNVTDSARIYMCRKHICGAELDQIAIDVNGDIYPCDYMVGSIEMKIGTIYHNSIHTLSSIREEFHNTFSSDFPECQDCAFISICGSCLYQSLQMKGKYGYGRPYCFADKNIIKNIIHILLSDQEYVDFLKSKQYEKYKR